jgi:aspartyl-tRNA(Asn)/glutamyl-tRNA(Gln) amidotransferase subunit C
MALTRKEVEHIAALVRLKLSDAELVEFQHQLSSILDHVRSLQELDTSGVEPTSGILSVNAGLRPDEPSVGLTPARVLQNARHKNQDQFRVPPVFGARDE